MDYKSNYEPLVYGWNGKHNFLGDKCNRDIWEVQRTKKNDLHPTMKPVELYERCVANHSKRDDIVLEFDKWNSHEEIINNYKIYHYPRNGYVINQELHSNFIKVNAPIIEISSTQIRKLIKDS
jgi:hypothetical protein